MRTAGDLTKYRSYLRDAYSYQDDGTRRCINEALRAEPQSSTTDHVLTDEEVSANIPRHPFRLAIYRQVSCSARGSNWTLCDHRVDLAAVSAVTQQISRYLFRVWGDRSAGLNSDGLFKSERAKQNLCGDLDTMREEDIHDSLFGHMCNRRENFASPWISFTTSVIWVVAKALRLMEDGHVDLKLAIVDTYDLPNGAYLFQADALLRAYNLEERMVYKNMARSMVLVWKDIQAPMAVVSLKQFLPDALTRGRVRPGYLTLQSFHFRGSDKQFAKAHGAKWKISTKASEKKKKKRKKNPSGLLKASAIRKKIYAEQPVREFLLEALRHQAPKSHRDYLAGRTFWGKRFDTRLKDFRTSISPFQLNDFALLVERNVTCPGFRLPMLIFLFSTLTKQFYRDSLVEAVRDLDRDDPIIRGYNKCVIREVTCSDLPELGAFETLLRDCSEELGIPVSTVSELPTRKFWTVNSPHTRIPKPQDDRSKLPDVLEDRGTTGIRMRKEKARGYVPKPVTFSAKQRMAMYKAANRGWTKTELHNGTSQKSTSKAAQGSSRTNRGRIPRFTEP